MPLPPLNILAGGEVTVGEAVIGNSPNANGIVNVTGPNAIFLSTQETLLSPTQGQVHSSDNDCGSWDR
jgi:hypothetical protein